MPENTKFLLAEDQIPTAWVNLMADLPGPGLPPLSPATMEPAGPADLAADMGHAGNSAAPGVQAAIRDILTRAAAAGKPCGILCLDGRTADYLDWGARFVAVGIDVLLLANAARALAARHRG